MSSGHPVRTIAVVSQVWAGHIPTYHRHYVAAFQAAGCRVLEIVPPSRLSWAARLSRPLDRFGWILSLRTWHAAARSLLAAERATGVRSEAAFLVFPELGFFHPAIRPSQVDRWFPWAWAGVLNSPLAIRGIRTPFPAGERVLAATRCRAAVVTDDAFVSPCRETWPGRVVLAMPEVADLSPPAAGRDLDKLREFARGRKLIGLLGVISEKKHVGPFLALARAAATTRPDLAFFLAGDFTAQACPGPERRRLAAELAHLPENCRLFPAPIPDGPVFNAWVASCDVVWVAYRDVLFKSNVLTKAAHFGKPVLVSPGAVMATHTERFALGAVVDVRDTGATLTAVGQLLSEPEARRDFAGFAALNAPERMRETVAGLLAAFESGPGVRGA